MAPASRDCSALSWCLSHAGPRPGKGGCSCWSLSLPARHPLVSGHFLMALQSSQQLCGLPVPFPANSFSTEVARIVFNFCNWPPRPGQGPPELSSLRETEFLFPFILTHGASVPKGQDPELGRLPGLLLQLATQRPNSLPSTLIRSNDHNSFLRWVIDSIVRKSLVSITLFLSMENCDISYHIEVLSCILKVK